MSIGYQEKDKIPGYNELKLDEGKEFYFRDASGYKSRHNIVAEKMPLDVKCERCGKPACSAYGLTSGGEPKHVSCLQCADEWTDFRRKPEYQDRLGLKEWENLWKEFCETWK